MTDAPEAPEGWEPPTILKGQSRIDGGCNFCRRDTRSGENYPVVLVTRPRGGLQARLCDWCLAHLNGNKNRRPLP